MHAFPKPLHMKSSHEIIKRKKEKKERPAMWRYGEYFIKNKTPFAMQKMNLRISEER